jgi:spermidine/putrescine transport system substrate-binding protein
MHPKERRSALNRRDFLLRSGGAALGLSSAGGLLAACGNSTTPKATTGSNGQVVGPGGYRLARPDQPPVLLKYWEDPIASNLPVETGGTFNIYNYPQYLDPAAMKEFGKKYGVTVQLTSFQDINSGIARLAAGGVHPDVMEMTPDNVERSVVAKLIKPLNLDYIPNLKNVWPALQSPFYDKGSRYTVPYTTYATGILWRNDQVTEDIASMHQPWDIFWNSQAYKGKVALLTEPRETIAMALLRRGITNINTEVPALINRAVADLKELNSICNVRLDDTQFQDVPADKTWLHQAWSGDMLVGCLDYYTFQPKGATSKVLSYWKAPTGHVPVQNDCWSICATTQKPVLSHLWLNFINDNRVAKSNFLNYNGYQPPLSELDPTTMISDGTFPENARDAILTTEDFGANSLQEMTLTNAGQALWQNGYAAFTAGG